MSELVIGSRVKTTDPIDLREGVVTKVVEESACGIDECTDCGFRTYYHVQWDSYHESVRCTYSADRLILLSPTSRRSVDSRSLLVL